VNAGKALMAGTKHGPDGRLDTGAAFIQCCSFIQCVSFEATFQSSALVWTDTGPCDHGEVSCLRMAC
jgi:hypothetical protein